MSFGKTSSKQKSDSQQSQTQNQTESQVQNQSETPNNLGAIQTGWDAAHSLLTGNPTLDAALGLTTAGANAATGAATGGLASATALAAGGAPNAANAYLTPFANGSLTGNNNPYFGKMISQMAQALQPQVDGSAAASGRYGSGANANAFHSALDNQTGQLAYSNFNDSMARQLQASQQLSTNNTASNNAVLQALGLIPGLGSAATGAGTALGAAGIAPTAAYADIIAMLGAGGGSSTASGVNTGSGTASGTASGTGSGSTSGFSIAPKFSFGPLSFGG